jgi:iron(III) transport system ATP-binding protein
VAALACRGVAKSYGARPVLFEVDLEVPSGTLTAILGASGSGKTTLLRVILGLEHPERGTVVVGGTVVCDERTNVAAERRGIGYVSQEGALFPHLTVAENVAFGLPRHDRRSGERVREVLALVGLGAEHGDRRPQEISGGEQRRVALARALAPKPGLVLLDEPFTGLDAALRSETRDAVVAKPTWWLALPADRR